MSTFRKYPEVVRLDKRPEILAVKQVVATVADLLKECGSEWQAATTLGVNDKQIRSAVTKTLGTVYRRMLIARVSS